MISELIHNYIEAHKEQILKDFVDFLKIPSISETDEAKNALVYVKSLYEKNGFECDLHEDYLLSHFKNGAKNIGLFAHADVVPVDDKWTVTKPFEPKIVNGELFARGSSDDKSAVIISLYALKILNELDIPFDSSLVCFTGANEEATMSDIKNYVKENTLPDFSLVIDSGFPVHYGDKGLLWLILSFDNVKFDTLFDLNGGNAYNIILGEANAVVKYSCELYDELLKNEKIQVRKNEDVIEIYAKGISNHGAAPWGTVNAGGVILEALFNSSAFNKKDKEKLELPLKLLTTYDGDALGIKSFDEIYKDTTVTNGVVKIENGKLKLSLDIRYGCTFTEKSLIARLNEIFEREEISYEIVKNGEPHHTDVNNKYVQACIKAYKEHTGEANATPRICAGSTYLRHLTNVIETGMTTKYNSCDLPVGHGSAHQPDEHINLDGFFEAIEIIVKMLIEIDKID